MPGKLYKMIKEMKTCKVEGCDSKYKAKEYCSRHYNQFNKYGKVLVRSVSDINEYIINDNHALITLYDVSHKIIAYAIIDLGDVEKCKKYKWGLKSTGYAFNQKVGFLHHYVKPRHELLLTDHENREYFG